MNHPGVLLDVSPVGSSPARRTGLARVALNLGEALSRRSDVRVACCAWGSVFASYDFGRFLATQSALAGAGARLSWWERLFANRWAEYSDVNLRVPRFLIHLGQMLNVLRKPLRGVDWETVDVVHSTYARFHPRLGHRHKPRVITVHDITPLKLPALLIPRQEKAIAGRLLAGIRSADWVVCVSEHTRNDLLNHLDHPRERVRVVYNGVDSQTFSPVMDRRQLESARQRHGLGDGPFLFTLSSLAPHKNLQVLLRSWPSVTREFPYARLVIAGGKGLKPELLMRHIGLPETPAAGIIVTGYIPDQDFVILASACQAFLFPSLYEGFGLPVLEAMACGAPVIASNATAIPEVVSDAGLLVDPQSEPDWSAAMCAALRAPLRVAPSAPHLRRAARFTWDRAAAEYRAIYAEACL